METILKQSMEQGEIVVRYPTMEDAVAMQTYINALSKEQTYITLQGKQLSLKEEKDFVKGQVKKNEEKKSVFHLLFVDNILSGISAVNALEGEIDSHVGIFGITISKDKRGAGLGRMLTELTLREAKKHLTDLQIITLHVFGNNPVAIQLYESLGFKECGRLPDGTFHKGTYVDDVHMYINVEEIT